MYEVNEQNCQILAIKAYDKPNIVMSEFESDFKRFKYVKRLINKYKRNKDSLKERLILNHIIVLGNVFGVELTTKILFLKIPEVDYSVIKTFLVFLNYMPNTITVNGNTILSSDISLDWNLVEILRRIVRGT